MVAAEERENFRFGFRLRIGNGIDLSPVARRKDQPLADMFVKGMQPLHEGVARKGEPLPDVNRRVFMIGSNDDDLRCRQGG